MHYSYADLVEAGIKPGTCYQLRDPALLIFPNSQRDLGFLILLYARFPNFFLTLKDMEN